MNTQLQTTSTANNEIKSAAQASCKTMNGRAKKPLSEKTVVAINELRELSEEANTIRLAYALAGGVMPTVNTVLICMYQDQTGCKDFRTFAAWREAGYSVKKGESAFRIWGQPIKLGSKNELPADAPDGTTSDELLNSKKLWPTCCVFDESQVQQLDEVTDNDTNTLTSDVSNVITPQANLDNCAVVRADHLEQLDNRIPRVEGVKIGSVFVASWGYEQTNINFYQVVGTTAKSLKLRAIAQTKDWRADQNEGGTTMPKIDCFTGDVFMRRYLTAHESVKIEQGLNARLWNGKPQSFTSYA